MLGNLEKAITKRIVSSAIKQGYSVAALADGDADVKHCKDLHKVLDGAFSYDCVDLCIKSRDVNGFICINFFNDGLDIISDYSVNIENFVSGLNFDDLPVSL